MTTITTITVAGNLTRDAEIRYTKDGQATSALTLAVNRRWQNRDTKEWEESTSFFDVVCWRELAENAALSLTKGARVVVSGRLEQRSWETDDGERRAKVEIVADDIGASLRFATAEIQKVERHSAAEELVDEATPGWRDGPRASLSRDHRAGVTIHSGRRGFTHADSPHTKAPPTGRGLLHVHPPAPPEGDVQSTPVHHLMRRPSGGRPRRFRGTFSLIDGPVLARVTFRVTFIRTIGPWTGLRTPAAWRFDVVDRAARYHRRR
jgi:single-strand DNA-binding protein